MTPNNFMQFQADAFRATNEMLTKSADSMQQLAAINAKFGKAAFEHSAEQMQNLIAAKDANAVTKVVTENAKPSPDLVTYISEVATLATKANADFMTAAEQHAAETNEKIDEALDSFAKVAPAGSEGVVTVLRQYVSTSRAAYRQATDASKQFAGMFASASKDATKDATAAKKDATKDAATVK